jgi:hypothetical protein
MDMGKLAWTLKYPKVMPRYSCDEGKCYTTMKKSDGLLIACPIAPKANVKFLIKIEEVHEKIESTFKGLRGFDEQATVSSQVQAIIKAGKRS